MEKLVSKEDLLGKLRSYTSVIDDETIQYKEKIKNALMQSPALLYALNNPQLEPELFDADGNINWNPETHEPYGAWDEYFGENENIRPFLFFPETQVEVKNYICYEVEFDELPRYSDNLKYTQITFTIFAHEHNTIDELTGIPRHDLIGSIIRERFNWSNIFGMQVHLISNKESVTDTHYLVRTLIFQLTDTNGITQTPYGGKTQTVNWQHQR